MPICRFSNPQGLGVSGPVAHLGEHRDQNTAGQRAIAAAEPSAMAEKEGRTLPERSGRAPSRGQVSDPSGHFGKLFGAGRNQVEQACALIRDDPTALLR